MLRVGGLSKGLLERRKKEVLINNSTIAGYCRWEGRMLGDLGMLEPY